MDSSERRPAFQFRFNDKAIIDAVNKANEAAGCPIEASKPPDPIECTIN